MKEYKGKVKLINVFKLENKLYLDSKITKLLECKSIEKKIINKIECTLVTEEEIKRIEETTSEMPIRLKANYIPIFFIELNIKYTIITDNDKYYITDELCKKNNLTAISHEIINNISYSQVSLNDLEDMEKRAKEKRITMTREYKEINNENKSLSYKYKYDPNKNIKYIDRKTLEELRKNNINIDTKPIIIDNHNCYIISDKDISIYFNKDNIIENNTKKFETILIYKNCYDNKLYIENNKISNLNNRRSKTLLNKECVEIEIFDLENTYNKEFIIVDLYTYNEPKEYSFIVCQTIDEIFIPINILETLNIQTEYNKKIRVNNEIYIKISKEKLNYIESLDSKNIKITITTKKIIPTRN